MDKDERFLRDLFAGFALIGFLAGKPTVPENHQDKSDNTIREAIAAIAYDFADAMLKARGTAP